MAENKDNPKNHRIIFVEPNDVYDKDAENAQKGLSLTPKYEDFCISFNLIIEAFSRFKTDATVNSVNSTGQTNTYSIQWGLTKEDMIKRRTSVLQGNRGDNVLINEDGSYGYSDSDYNYLTTYFTDLTFDSYKNKTQIEGLGVESVQVSYESWYTPTVTIKFVDVRGSALFGREEAIHIDEKLTAENIFGAFFTMPYPLFRLQVKGFLGKPVTYQLTCSSFKGELNSQTGNFEAVATFIGYSWSLLTDVPFAYLVAAPYAPYIGADYWNEHRNSKAWGLWNDGDTLLPPMKMFELFNNIKAAVAGGDYGKATEQQSEELLSMEKEESQLNKLVSHLNTFLESLKTKVDKNCYAMFDEREKCEQLLLFSNSETIQFSDDDEVVKNFEEFYQVLSEYSNGEYTTSSEIGLDSSPNKWKKFPSTLKFLDRFTITNNTNGYTTSIVLNGIGEPNVEKIQTISFNELDKGNTLTMPMAQSIFNLMTNDAKNTVLKRYAYLVNLGGITKITTDRLNAIEKRKNEILKEINENIGLNIIDILSTKHGGVSQNDGFKPFIGNIFKLIFCHLETFCHIMFDSADEIYSQMKNGYRSPQMLGIDMGGTDIRKGACRDVTPWPALFNNGVKSSDCGYQDEQSEVYGWVGDIPGHKFIEEKVVYALQEGIQKIVNEKDQEYNAMKFDGFPMIPSDFSMNNNVFASIPSITNMSELSGYLALRMTNIFGVTCGNNVSTDLAKLLGRIDAYNFYDRIGSIVSLSKVMRNATSDIMEGIMYCRQGKEYEPYAIQDKEGNQANRHYAFETRKIKYNLQGRQPFFIDSNSSTSDYVHFYDANDINYVPCTMKEFMLYANKKEEGDFTYSGESIQNAVFTPNFTKDKESRDWLYVADSTKIDAVENKDEYVNRYMFNVISDESSVSSIKNKYLRLKDGNLKVGEYDVKDELTEYISKFMRIGDSYKSKFFKDVRYMLSGNREALKISSDDLLPDDNVNGKLPKKLNCNQWLKTSEGEFNNSVEVKDDGSLSFNGTDVNLSDTVIQQFKVRYLGHDCNIFGCPFYYMQNGIREADSEEFSEYRAIRSKALLFLHTFKYDYRNIVLNVFDKEKKNGLTEEVPKAYLLLLGGLLWRRRYYTMHGKDPIVFALADNSERFVSCGVDYTLFSDNGKYAEFNVYRKNAKYNFPISRLFGGDSEIDYNIENQLIGLFEEFSKTTFNNIANRYELTCINGTQKVKYYTGTLKKDIVTIRQFIKYEGKNEKVDVNLDNKQKFEPTVAKFIEWVTKYGFTGWLGKYSAIYVDPTVDANEQGISLLFNEKDAEYQSIFKDLYFNSYIVADSCYRRMGRSIGSVNETDKIKVSKDLIKSYLEGFKTACDNLINEETVTVGGGEGVAISRGTLKNRDLSIAIYYYLKNLWDKWLVIADKGAFDVENYFMKNFVFIDSFYKNVYHLLAVNCQMLYDAWDELADNGSLFHFLSDIVTKHGCIFLPVPDYIGFNGNTQREDIETMEDVFRPMPYNSIEAPSNSNKFVVIYTHSPSHILTDDNGYKTDSYDLWSHDLNEPTDDAKKRFSTTTSADFDRDRDTATREGYNVPSFGVSFARQNNHIFKNLKVTMDNPVMTEQSIKAMWSIATKGSSNTHSISFIGQDTFNVFSNYSYSVEIEMMGNAQICPLMYFQLMNVPLWRGTYMIYKVVHNMTAGNMTTTITAMKMNKYAKPFNTSFFVIHELPPVNRDETALESECGEEGTNTQVNTDGNFKYNPEEYNLKKACEWLQQNSQMGSQGKCAKFVRLAIEKGFNDPKSTNGRPNWAWKYIYFLPTIGFEKVLHHVKGKTDYIPEKGDIAVYKKNNDENVPGHICMYTGTQWCSDFKQRSMYVYSSTNEADIFRYKGKKIE